MKLFIDFEDGKGTRFMFRNVTVSFDKNKNWVTFCPYSCDRDDYKEFAAVKSALLDYAQSFYDDDEEVDVF